MGRGREKRKEEMKRGGEEFLPLMLKYICTRGDEGEDDGKFLLSPLSS